MSEKFGLKNEPPRFSEETPKASESNQIFPANLQRCLLSVRVPGFQSANLNHTSKRSEDLINNVFECSINIRKFSLQLISQIEALKNQSEPISRSKSHLCQLVVRGENSLSSRASREASTFPLDRRIHTLYDLAEFQF